MRKGNALFRGHSCSSVCLSVYDLVLPPGLLQRVTGEWRRLHNKKLYALYSTPNIIRVIRSRKMRRTWQVACIGRKEVNAGFWWGNLREEDRLEDTRISERIILSWIFKKWDGRALTGSIWLRNRWHALVNAVMNIWGSIKCPEFLD
jgi:hypothetical protein